MTVYWPTDKVHQTQIWATPLIELAMSRGACLDALLRGTSLFKQDLSNSEHKISAQQLMQLISNCQKHTRSQDLSFMLGRRIVTAQNSKFSQLLQHCRDLRQVTKVFQLYQTELFPFAFVEVKQYQQDLYWVLNCAVLSEQQQFVFEVLCSAIYHTSKGLCGKLIPYSFSFETARPRNIYQFEENLGPRLSFSQPVNWIKIDLSHLAAPVQSGPSFTRLSWLQQCRQQRLKNSEFGVIQYLYRAMKRGDVNNLEQAAELLNISPATLKRKLKLTSISFQMLQDMVRKQEAIFNLAVCKQNNGEVARKLKFSDVTNFRRAFKRWTGITPAQLRSD